MLRLVNVSILNVEHRLAARRAHQLLQFQRLLQDCGGFIRHPSLEAVADLIQFLPLLRREVLVAGEFAFVATRLVRHQGMISELEDLEFRGGHLLHLAALQLRVQGRKVSLGLLAGRLLVLKELALCKRPRLLWIIFESGLHLAVPARVFPFRFIIRGLRLLLALAAQHVQLVLRELSLEGELCGAAVVLSLYDIAGVYKRISAGRNGKLADHRIRLGLGVKPQLLEVQLLALFVLVPLDNLQALLLQFIKVPVAGLGGGCHHQWLCADKRNLVHLLFAQVDDLNGDLVE